VVYSPYSRNPPSLHRYLYAYGNPGIYIDADGNNPELFLGNEYYEMAMEAQDLDPYDLNDVITFHDQRAEEAKTGVMVVGGVAAIAALGWEAAIVTSVIRALGWRGAMYSVEANVAALTLAEEGVAITTGAQIAPRIDRTPDAPRLTNTPTQNTKVEIAVENPSNLESKTVYVDSRGNATIADAELPKNHEGGNVIVPDGHRQSPRDPGYDKKPIIDIGPFTNEEREAFLGGSSGGTKLSPHHRNQIPTEQGGVIDEIPGPGHPAGNQHTKGSPNRHPNKSIFKQKEGGNAQRQREIRNNRVQKGERLIQNEDGEWFDPGVDK
jgi:hypothetical protein